MKLFKRNHFFCDCQLWKDFKDREHGDDCEGRRSAREAELIFQSWLSEQVIVYAHDDFPPIWGTMWTFKPAEQMGIKLTATARLVCVEEIK